VLAMRFRISIDEVALCHTGPLDGYVRITGGPLIKTLKHPRVTELTWMLVRRDAEQRIMVFLAGALAEAKLLATPMRSHGCGSDLRKCLFLCDALRYYRERLVEARGISIPEIDAADLTDRLRRRTQRILGHPDTWKAVTALAADLEGWGQLTGHDSADTVQWAARSRDQLALLLPMPPSRKAPKPATREDGVATRHFTRAV
jgi:hypothetical protein